jgi:hypothetical protein
VLFNRLSHSIRDIDPLAAHLHIPGSVFRRRRIVTQPHDLDASRQRCPVIARAITYFVKFVGGLSKQAVFSCAILGTGIVECAG